MLITQAELQVNPQHKRTTQPLKVRTEALHCATNVFFLRGNEELPNTTIRSFSLALKETLSPD